MQSLLHPNSPFRIFWFSVAASIGIVAAVVANLGWKALFITLVLIVIEITFSFENAIVNAKILQHMSRFWQNIFLTIGILIAIFGMRIVFPIAIVAITADLSWQTVLDLALNDPEAYSAELDKATPTIVAFGGAFLLMLATSFFFDKRRGVHWFGYIEEPMQRWGYTFVPHAISILTIIGLSALPANEHPQETLVAGFVGILTYTFVHGLSEFFGRIQSKKNKIKELTGMAAFASFLYLELLDASFSLDGVIGAFAITNQVIIIAAGLGIGAIWVRSLTIFMVRRGTLKTYRYIEHGAFYTVSILAGVLLIESIIHIPEAAAGLIGIIVISSSIIASNRYKNKHVKAKK
jgi:hypothetical protein